MTSEKASLALRHHPLPTRGRGMMLMLGSSELESSAITPFAAEEKIRHTCNGRRTCTGFLRNHAVRLACSYPPCHLQTLTHRPQLREGCNVTEKACRRTFRRARGKSFAESTEPRVRFPSAFGECALRHNSDRVTAPFQCVNVLSCCYISMYCISTTIGIYFPASPTSISTTPAFRNISHVLAPPSTSRLEMPK